MDLAHQSPHPGPSSFHVLWTAPTTASVGGRVRRQLEQAKEGQLTALLAPRAAVTKSLRSGGLDLWVINGLRVFSGICYSTAFICNSFKSSPSLSQALRVCRKPRTKKQWLFSLDRYRGFLSHPPCFHGLGSEGDCVPPLSCFPKQEPQVCLCRPQRRLPLLSLGQNEQLETWCLELLRKSDSPM